MTLRSAAYQLALVLLLIQACGNRGSSTNLRSFSLPDGGFITVERMMSLGQEGEQVIEYDRGNQQIGVAWCPDGTYDEMVILFRKFRHAVVSGNQQDVADLMEFPFALNAGERRSSIRDRAELKRRDHEILTPAVVKRLAAASPQAVFCTGDGASFAGGTVWTRTRKVIMLSINKVHHEKMNESLVALAGSLCGSPLHCWYA